MDGFVLTHAVEAIDVPDQEQVDRFVPPFVPRQVLDPAHPITIGAMVGPDAFSEVKYLAAAHQLLALDEVRGVGADFERSFGRSSGGLVRSYRTRGADTVVVAMGSVMGAVEDVVDDLRDEGVAVGALAVTCFRPWPLDEVREALAGASTVIVLERAFSVGSGAILGSDIRLAVNGMADRVIEVIAGLGGRPVTCASVRALLDDVLADRVDPHSLHFLDLDRALVEHELEAEATSRSVVTISRGRAVGGESR